VSRVTDHELCHTPLNGLKVRRIAPDGTEAIIITNLTTPKQMTVDDLGW
jgi:hypothetical protein